MDDMLNQLMCITAKFYKRIGCEDWGPLVNIKVDIRTCLISLFDIVTESALLQAACKNAPDSSDAKRAVELLYDTALISSGFTVSTMKTLQILHFFQ